LNKNAGNPEVDSHSCAEFWENCYATIRKDDWTPYLKCLHENFSVYADCGRQALIDKNFKKQQ
jgi:hypothetical protein